MMISGVKYKNVQNLICLNFKFWGSLFFLKSRNMRYIFGKPWVQEHQKWCQIQKCPKSNMPQLQILGFIVFFEVTEHAVYFRKALSTRTPKMMSNTKMSKILYVSTLNYWVGWVFWISHSLMQRWVRHTAWSSKGRKGRSQGPPTRSQGPTCP